MPHLGVGAEGAPGIGVGIVFRGAVEQQVVCSVRAIEPYIMREPEVRKI